MNLANQLGVTVEELFGTRPARSAPPASAGRKPGSRSSLNASSVARRRTAGDCAGVRFRARRSSVAAHHSTANNRARNLRCGPCASWAIRK